MADKPSVPNNIYTVLTLIAMIALLVAVAYVIMRSTELFGTWNPMDAEGLRAMIQTGVQATIG